MVPLRYLLLAALVSADGDHQGPLQSVPSTFQYWTPYSTPLIIPEVIDMRDGGEYELVIGETSHSLGAQKHLFARNVDMDLVVDESACYPTCGVPVAVHVHGLENPPEYDDLPIDTFYNGDTYSAIYKNHQMPATKVYHDHTLGLSRLNMWAGLVGLYILTDPELEAKFNLDQLPDIPITLQDKNYC
ncbi:hypothetical protein THRCLA_20954 [Thraustotheca clavata]|uniref:Plastocyanin-like domain-containing protein n=1 Tax=Thraustotheca clavata TaxID=74557 RepID=A0A1W0A1K9_9STRA|nr:hypothetical protein THRCLA_20954 [Thraustotheca clavata]